MQTWDEWLQINAEKIKHIANFEEIFVNTIFRHIPELSPEDVISQYGFRDFSGGNRYIDFMIKNESKGYLLPIELDGYWKVENYRDFNDMLLRQNALVTQYHILLRYTNKQMLNEAERIISEIRQVLKLQQEKQNIESIAKQQQKQQLLTYQQELNTLKQDLKEKHKQNQQSDYKHELLSIQKTLQELELKLSNVQKSPVNLAPSSANSSKLVFGYISFGVIMAIAFFSGVYFFMQSAKDSHVPKQAKPESVVSQPLPAAEKNVNTEIEKLPPVPIEQSRLADKTGFTELSTRENVHCGTVVEIKSFSKGYYLNVGQVYPHQDFSAVIWHENLSEFGSLNNFVNKRICVMGVFEYFKGMAQIKLLSQSELVIQE